MFGRLILIGVLLAAASGCGSGGTIDRTEANSTSVAGPDYETQVNALGGNHPATDSANIRLAVLQSPA